MRELYKAVERIFQIFGQPKLVHSATQICARDVIPPVLSLERSHFVHSLQRHQVDSLLKASVGKALHILDIQKQL